MARIEAEVLANINPFKRALDKAAEQAREWGEKVKDVGKDFTKEVAGGGVSNMLGLAGTGVAVAALGAGIVEVAKKSVEAFGHFETKVLELKANLKDPSVARDVAEWIETIMGAGGGFDDLFGGMRSLLASGLDLGQAKATLTDLQGVAIKTGESVTDLAEAFRKAKAGGLDAGEGASRLLKSLLGLAAWIEPQIAKAASDFKAHAPRTMNEMGQMAMSAADKATYDAMRKETPADFVKKGHLDTAGLEKFLHESAPQDLVEQKKETPEGKMEELGAAVERLEVKIGQDLAPTVGKFVDDLTAAMPSLEAGFASVTQSISTNVLPALTAFAKFLGDTFHGAESAGGGEVGYFTGLGSKKLDPTTQQLKPTGYPLGPLDPDYLRDSVRLGVDKMAGIHLPDLAAMQRTQGIDIKTGAVSVAPVVDKLDVTNQLLKQLNAKAGFEDVR